MVVINNALKPSFMQKHTRIRLYKLLARPVLCYSSEAWTIKKKDKSQMTACEMRFMWRTAGYTKWDLKRSEGVMKELKKSSSANEYNSDYQSHVNQTEKGLWVV
jgi:hypothetical protein